MSDDRQPSVLGSLPRTRPHRRSDKRPQTAPAAEVSETPKAKAAAASAKLEAASSKPKAASTKRTAKPPATGARRAATPKAGARASVPASERRDSEVPDTVAESHGPLETTVQAAAELAEIGLHASARALRGALSRLPRP